MFLVLYTSYFLKMSHLQISSYFSVISAKLQIVMTVSNDQSSLETHFTCEYGLYDLVNGFFATQVHTRMPSKESISVVRFQILSTQSDRVVRCTLSMLVSSCRVLIYTKKLVQHLFFISEISTKFNTSFSCYVITLIASK